MSDATRMRELLCGAEAILDTEGWDVPAKLVIVARSGDSLRLHGAMRHVPDPGPFIAYLGAEALNGDDFGSLVIREHPDFFAIGLIHEGWTLNTEDPKVWEEQRRHPIDMADHPLGIEIRSCSFVDIDGVVHSTFRKRGHELQYVNSVGGTKLSGRIFEGLAKLCLAVAREIPDGAAYVSTAAETLKQIQKNGAPR